MSFLGNSKQIYLRHSTNFRNYTVIFIKLLCNSKWLLAISLIAYSNSLSAQQFFFKQYTTKQGLANNQTFDLIQSSDGNLWIATLDGLNRFNGTTFKKFSENEGLPSKLIIEVFEDSKNRIWVGTVNKGISILEKDSVYTPNEIDFISFGAINHFFETADGAIYIFGNSKIGKFCEGKFSVVYGNVASEAAIFPMDVAYYDSEHLLLASTRNGVLLFNTTTNTITPFLNQENGINNLTYSVFVDKDNAVWVGSYGVLYKYAQDKLEEFVPDYDQLDRNRMFDIKSFADNQLSIATEGNGLLRFSLITNEFDFINASKGLPVQYVYDHIQDTEGNIWMASYDGGLLRFRDDAFSIINSKIGLKSNSVSLVVEWQDQWVLATEEGLYFLRNANVERVLFQGERITSLELVNDEKLIVATQEAVYEVNSNYHSILLDEGNYMYAFQDTVNSFLVGRDVKVISKDSIFKKSWRRTNRVLPFGKGYLFMKLYGLFEVNAFEQDTISGLHPSNYSVFKSMSSISDKEVLALNESHLIYLKKEPDSILLKKWPLSTWKLKQPRAITYNSGAIWMAADQKFIEINLSDLMENRLEAATSYPSPIDFSADESSSDTMVITSKDEILLATPEGLLVFDPDRYSTTAAPPQLQLAQVNLFSEPLDSIYYDKENKAVLTHTQNYLTFDMEAISHTFPEKLQYKYRLTGIREGDQWSAPSNDNKVVYSYLPPGDYNFEFTASNGNGVWSPTSKSFAFEITQPFWKTLWFWILSILLLGLTGFLWYYRQSQAKLAQQTYLTQNLLRVQEEERTRIARELHDSVGQKLILLAKKTAQEETSQSYDLAKESLEEVRTISRGLYPAHLSRLGITASLRNLVNEFDEATDIFFTHDIENLDAYLKTDACLLIFRILQETLSNATKHSNATSITVEGMVQKPYFELTVSDNGIGIDKNIDSSKPSLGIETVAERAKLLQATLEIKTKKNYGTSVHLKIPLYEQK